MRLYHGTDMESALSIVNDGILLKYGDESVDNGQGFYTTPNFEFAFERAKNTALSKSKFENKNIEPAVLALEIDLESAKLSKNVVIKNFNGCTYDWKEFVVLNRLGKRFMKKWSMVSDNHNLDQKYDFVIDETADSHIADIISSMRYSKNIENFQDNILKVDKSERKNWDKQISLHTDSALKFIKSISIMNN